MRIRIRIRIGNYKKFEKIEKIEKIEKNSFFVKFFIFAFFVNFQVT